MKLNSELTYAGDQTRLRRASSPVGVADRYSWVYNNS